MQINEFESNFLECFVTLRILNSGFIIQPLVKKEVAVKTRGKRALFIGFACLKGLFELLLLEVVAPCVYVLVL
jgi:hypothetical protein